MKKKIGIVGWKMGNGFGITLPYMAFFSHFGNVEIISHTETEVRELDLLVIPGGPDVDVSRYLDEENEDISLSVGNPCPIRERFDRILLPKYIESRTPIFGICRGHQSLNVEFGGRLVQHMFHETTSDTERNKLVHGLFLENTQLIPGLRNRSFEVNSLHHQIIDEEYVPTNCRILARHSNKAGTTRDGVIESVTYYPSYPAHSVQWHPEEIYDEFSMTLINHLLNPELW